MGARRSAQNQISGQPGHRKKKNNRKDNNNNNIIIYITNAHRDEAHAFTLFFFFFVFGADLGVRIIVTPRDKDVGFYVQVYNIIILCFVIFIRLFNFFFNVKFETQHCSVGRCRYHIIIVQIKTNNDIRWTQY